VVRVTGNFTSERPLSSGASEALAAAFDQGWADPKKISQSSSKAAILRDHALELIASRLSIPVGSIHPLGEPDLAPYLALGGFLRPSHELMYSAVDKGKVRAVARAHTGATHQLECDARGRITTPVHRNEISVMSLQLANGETGAVQEVENFVGTATHIVCDATASANLVPLPSKWSAAYFDARSWNGPAGLSILAINDGKNFTYPLPHIAPIKSPGSYSLPLLLAAATALDEFNYDRTHFAELRNRLIASIEIHSSIAEVAVDGLPHLVSLLVEGVAAEQLVRTLSERGFSIDAGSACNPEDLQPSHVIAAMGLPTTGHIRITLHSDSTSEEVDQLALALTTAVDELSR
jgi:cysteine desulfurase